MTVKEFIIKEIDSVNAFIAEGKDKETNIQLKKNLSETLYLLDIFEKYRIKKETVETVFELPVSNTGYSDYRIINDCESDDPDQWLEVSISGEKIRLSEGDLVIRKK